MIEKGWNYDNNYDWVLQKTVRIKDETIFFTWKGSPQLYRYDFKDLSISFQASQVQNPQTERTCPEIRSMYSKLQTNKDNPENQEKDSLYEIPDELFDDVVPDDLSISAITNEFFPSKETFIPLENINTLKTFKRSKITFKEFTKFATETDQPIDDDDYRMLKTKSVVQRGRSLEKERPSFEDDIGVEGNLLIKTISLKIPDTKKNPRNRTTIKNVIISGDESLLESRTFKNKQ